MEQKAIEFIKYVNNGMPKHNKAEAQNAAKARFNLTKKGKIYFCDEFAVTFAYSKNSNFSNTIAALSKLCHYDNIPFFVVLIRGNQDNLLYLANSTFIEKISHSSQHLRIDNIRGSFLGSNIIKTYKGIPNDAEHAEQLFEIHKSFTWEENLTRLVKATSGIKPIKTRFRPDNQQYDNILSSIKRAKTFIASPDYATLKADLDDRVRSNLHSISIASHIENVNIRGRLIEHIITSNNGDILKDEKDLEAKLPIYDTRNGIGDYVRRFATGNTFTDIKTKLMYLESAPKGYNIDKFLEKMGDDDSIFLFYFVGIDKQGIKNSILCSVYDKRLLNATKIQFHWAGRDTRGVAQFEGKAIAELISTKDFTNDIDEDKCKDFIEDLLKR